jgi:hypothetical protein
MDLPFFTAMEIHFITATMYCSVQFKKVWFYLQRTQNKHRETHVMKLSIKQKERLIEQVTVKVLNTLLNESTRNLELEKLAQQRVERMLRDLASDLADLVSSGDITEQEANEWLASKQEQWLGGDY